MSRAERSYAARVRSYEQQGMTTSDAQGVVDAEDMKPGRISLVVFDSSAYVRSHGKEPRGLLRVTTSAAMAALNCCQLRHPLSDFAAAVASALGCHLER